MIYIFCLSCFFWYDSLPHKTRQLLIFVLKCWHIQFGTLVPAWVIRCSTFIPQQQHTSDPQLRYKMGPGPIVLNGVTSNDPLKMNGRKFVQNHGNWDFFHSPKKGVPRTRQFICWIDNAYRLYSLRIFVFSIFQLNTCFPDQGRSKPVGGFVGGNEEKVRRKLSLVRNWFVKIENPWRNRELMFV